MFDKNKDICHEKKIIVKNIFHNEFPVTRSQARKLCSSFEKFEKIILDFEGVNEIGQAFADEIFRKYKINKPKIVLIVENANENVNNMIKHVQNTKN